MTKDPERKAAYDRAYRLKNRKHRDAVYAAWYAKNRQRRSAYNKAYKSARLEHNASLQKTWRLKHPERYAEIQKLSHAKNRRWRRDYHRRRMAEDVQYRLRRRLDDRLRKALKNLSKGASSREMLGCAIEDFKLHIESNWESGMSWGNYGEWQLDHMMPCAVFDLTKPEHQKRCFHFSNIRPMWRLDNLKKGKQVTTNQYNLL